MRLEMNMMNQYMDVKVAALMLICFSKKLATSANELINQPTEQLYLVKLGLEFTC